MHLDDSEHTQYANTTRHKRLNQEDVLYSPTKTVLRKHIIMGK